MKKCYYCEGKAVKLMICNDWDTIPLCDSDRCEGSFHKENKSQYFEEKIKD